MKWYRKNLPIWQSTAAFADEHGFIRYSLPFALVWLIGILVIMVSGWSALESNLLNMKAAAEERALHDARTFADAYAERLYRSLQAIDQITLYVKHGWESAGINFHLESITQSGSLAPNSGFYVSIVDRHGFLLSSTITNPLPANASDYPYFVKQKNAEKDSLYIGYPMQGTYTPQTVVQFSRRLETADGSFNGVVLVAIEPAYFIAQYDEGIIGENRLLTILDSDKTVRIARIGNTVYGSTEKLFTKTLPISGNKGEVMLPGESWFADKRSRYVAWHSTEGYGMIALAGIDRHEVLAPFRAQRHNRYWYAGAASVLFTILSLFGTLAYARLRWRKYQFFAMQATYRTATEGGQEGFYIARPIEDSTGEVVDFRFIDCNERGATLLKHRRHELIGKTIRTVYHGEASKGTMQLLKHTLSTRHFAGEIKARPGDPSELTWLYVTVSKPDGDLAVTLRDISDMKAHVTELERRSYEDTLTGLPNRLWLKNQLPGALESAKVSEQMLAVLFIDLDGFKAVNDTMGHEAGDDLLRAAAHRLKEAIRPHDYAVRIGGDEFVVIVANMSQKLDAALVAERVLHSFSQSFRLSKGVHTVGTSIGISVFPEDGQDTDTLLKHADMAMYTVKTSGKRNYRFFNEKFFEAMQSKHQREIELRDGLEQDQFVLYYQPRVDLVSGQISSMEALVRWAHPTSGVVEPCTFIPLAEETGLIVQLGEQVFNKVCAQLSLWLRAGQKLVPVSINVSAKQFQAVDIAESLATALSRYHVPASLIELELTESTMMGSSTEICESLYKLQAMGITLLVDDFGTGYSSLSQLQELDFDVLKVDKAFTARLQTTPNGRIFFAAIITMAHSLGMRVVAEGVETSEQMQSLKELQCDEVQGYLISKPIAPPERQSGISSAASTFDAL